MYNRVENLSEAINDIFEKYLISRAAVNLFYSGLMDGINEFGKIKRS